MSSLDYCVAKPNRCFDHGASDADFQTSNHESYLGDGRLFDLSSRKSASGGRSSSRRIASVGRGGDYDPKSGREVGSSRRNGTTICRDVSRGICDCGRDCKKKIMM